jgi:hypothetical protein
MFVGGSFGLANYDTSGGSFVLQLNKGDVVSIQNMDSVEIFYGYHYS